MTNFGFYGFDPFNSSNQSNPSNQQRKGNHPKWNFTPKKKRPKTFIMITVITVIVAAIAWYLYHPVLNWHSPNFMMNLIIFGGAALVITNTAVMTLMMSEKAYRTFNKIFFSAIAIFIGGVVVLNLVTSSMFNAKEYANRINIVETDFSTIEEVDFTKTPIIDRASTMALGDRVMGQMPELVSQFEVSDEYTQISYRDSVYRVTPLEYADFFKYISNRDEGIPAYILVNSTTGEAELVKLKDLGLDGMRYVPSGMFNENLQRILQLKYPTEIFGNPSFEIDEEGHPWYVCTTYTYKAVGNKRSVKGVVLFDPITGKSTMYDNVLDAPTWVDRIHPESLVVEEIDNNGSLSNGFINSVIGQKNVVKTSDGYNYLEKGGDIWIYSGITSVSADSANLGFVLVNLRTHEALRINSAGADEFSAMNSAEGEVKNYGYYSTFPLLVNVADKPVYLTALKDNAGLIKMYAMVDATDYQRVVTVGSDEGLETLKNKFISSFGGKDISSEMMVEKTIEIAEINFYSMNGTTKAYITDTVGNNYKMILSEANEDILAFVKAGDRIKVEFIVLDGEDVYNINKMTK